MLSPTGREVLASSEANFVKGLVAGGERRVRDTDLTMHLTNEVHGRGPGTPERLLLGQ